MCYRLIVRFINLFIFRIQLQALLLNQPVGLHILFFSAAIILMPISSSADFHKSFADISSNYSSISSAIRLSCQVNRATFS